MQVLSRKPTAAISVCSSFAAATFLPPSSHHLEERVILSAGADVNLNSIVSFQNNQMPEDGRCDCTSAHGTAGLPKASKTVFQALQRWPFDQECSSGRSLSSREVGVVEVVQLSGMNSPCFWRIANSTQHRYSPTNHLTPSPITRVSFPPFASIVTGR
jgi:hypothetical protein